MNLILTKNIHVVNNFAPYFGNLFSPCHNFCTIVAAIDLIVKEGRERGREKEGKKRNTREREISQHADKRQFHFGRDLVRSVV